MKKVIIFLMVALMALTAVFANGNTEKTSTESEEITLDFWVRFNDDLSGVIADFEALHPSVKINQVQIGENWDDLVAKYNAAMQAGNMPELGLVGQRHGIPQIYDAGYLIPIENYMSKEEQSEISDNFWTRYTYDGKKLVMPFGCSTPIVMVNMTILRSLGYDSVPSTWDGMVEAAKKAVKDTNGDGITDIYGINFNSDTPWYIQPLVWCAGGRIATDDGGANVVTPEMELVLSRYANLVKDGIMPASQHKTAGQDFQNGRLLFYFISCSAVNKYAKNIGSSFEFGVAEFPSDKTFDVSVGGGGIAIFKSTDKKQEMAAEFIKYLNTPEASVKASLSLGYLPFTSGQFELDYVKELEKDPKWQVILKQARNIRGEGVSPVDSIVWNDMTKILSEIEANPNMNINEALVSMQKEIDEYMALY